MSRSRFLLWALLCQALLNHKNLENIAEQYGTNMSIPADYKELVSWLATAKVRLLLSELMHDRDYVDKVSEGNPSFLRTDKAFDECMEIAHKKLRWVQKNLVKLNPLIS